MQSRDKLGNSLGISDMIKLLPITLTCASEMSMSSLEKLSAFRYTESSSKRSRFEGDSITQHASDLSAAATLVATASISNVQSCEPEIDIVRPNDLQAGSMGSPALTIPGFIFLSATNPSTAVFHTNNYFRLQ